jgi:hypothetical protein
MGRLTTITEIRVDDVTYPDAMYPELVGRYEPLSKAGGGFVWDEVLAWLIHQKLKS